MWDNTIWRLRIVGIIEGISYLALLGIAMPLKYLAGMPLAVRIVGMAHGVLFILFCVAVIQAWTDRGWPLSRAALVFVSSLVPFGTFLIDKSLKAEQQPA